ncbi:hypothetical protein SARC_01244 [Sphaeroforma arctica JP610]|uniref:Adenylate kinase n=1 Tax=Sphaeroforma arctica JP610 TaxID=667725 RepID=A0A0L0GCA2_9EUKA|nr:hypothetical protein SARC_01244 [Sphaeroforma arctica JP610]KNC86615.1 hypothetical protein SARC_01244 [Sphaeroforma arctica JP610]|eukprot:XP_014160517.1 hypothetical protein SARC_01244 [Sphaeroforma arctica JP610]
MVSTWATEEIALSCGGVFIDVSTQDKDTVAEQQREHAVLGIGKGTLSQRLMETSGVGHISTGEMLRDEVEAKTPLGLEVASIMDQGQLVEPHIVMRMLREYLQTQPGRYLDRV